MGGRGPVSFHPKMAYDATFHKSARTARGRGAAVRLHAAEPRAVRRDHHALSARSAALGGAAGALSRAVTSRATSPPTRSATSPSCSASRAPTSRTSCRTTRCSTPGRSGSSSSTCAARCRARSTAPSASPRSCTAKLGDHAGRDRRQRHVHAGRSRVSRRVRPRAGGDGQRRAGTSA